MLKKRRQPPGGYRGPEKPFLSFLAVKTSIVLWIGLRVRCRGGRDLDDADTRLTCDPGKRVRVGLGSLLSMPSYDIGYNTHALRHRRAGA